MLERRKAAKTSREDHKLSVSAAEQLSVQLCQQSILSFDFVMGISGRPGFIDITPRRSANLFDGILDDSLSSF